MDFKIDFLKPFLKHLLVSILLMASIDVNAQVNAQQTRPRIEIPLEDITVSVDMEAARNFDASQISTQRLNNIQHLLNLQQTEIQSDPIKVEAFIGQLMHDRQIEIGFFSKPTIDLFMSMCPSVSLSANSGLNTLCEVVKNSEVCQAVEPDDLLSCDELHAETMRNPVEFLGGCTEGLLDSASQILSFIWDALKHTFSAMISPIDTAIQQSQEVSQYLASTKLYLANEYDKAYQEASPPFQAMKAARGVASSIASLLINNIQEFLQSQYQEFGCLNFRARMETTCLIAGDLLIPPMSAIQLLKYGPKAIKASSRLSQIIAEKKRVIQTRRLSRIKDLAERSLNKRLTNQQVQAIQNAHLIGRGQPGADGSPARIGNYTLAQLRRKADILKQAGFSPAEIRELMEDGVVGISSTRWGRLIHSNSLNYDHRPEYEAFRKAFNSNSITGDNRYVEFNVGTERFIGEVKSLNRRNSEVTIETFDGQVFEVKGIDELEKISVSSQSKFYFKRLLELTGDNPARDDFRINWNRLSIDYEHNRYISFMSGNTRLPGRIIQMEENRLLIENPQGQRFYISGDGLLHVQQSSNARDHFKSSAPSPLLNRVEYNFASRKLNDYRWHDGRLVEVDMHSPRLQRWVRTATDIITKETGIPPKLNRELSTEERHRLYEAYLRRIVPMIESKDKANYAQKRGCIMQGGRATLSEILDSQAAVCSDLSMFASVLLSEYNVRSKIVTGRTRAETAPRRNERGEVVMVEVSENLNRHAWIQIYDRNNRPLEILDSNYTRSVHPNFEDYSQNIRGGVNSHSEQALVRPLTP